MSYEDVWPCRLRRIAYAAEPTRATTPPISGIRLLRPLFFLLRAMVVPFVCSQPSTHPITTLAGRTAPRWKNG